MSPWTRLAIVVGVMVVTIVVARLIDRRIARRDLPPEAITRYRILRRSITTTIIFVGPCRPCSSSRRCGRWPAGCLRRRR
jgi:hypothetical protein